MKHGYARVRSEFLPWLAGVLRVLGLSVMCHLTAVSSVFSMGAAAFQCLPANTGS
jgi:hypothetical protein